MMASAGRWVDSGKTLPSAGSAADSAKYHVSPITGEVKKTKQTQVNERMNRDIQVYTVRKVRNQREKMGVGEGERRMLGLMLDCLFHKTDRQSGTAGLTGKLYGVLDNNRCDTRI